MALINGSLILVIRAGLEFSTANPAFVAIRLDGINIDIIWMVIIIDTQATSHNPVFSDLPVKDHFDNYVQIDPFQFEGLIQFLRLSQVPWKAV